MPKKILSSLIALFITLFFSLAFAQPNFIGIIYTNKTNLVNLTNVTSFIYLLKVSVFPNGSVIFPNYDEIKEELNISGKDLGILLWYSNISLLNPNFENFTKIITNLTETLNKMLFNLTRDNITIKYLGVGFNLTKLEENLTNENVTYFFNNLTNVALEYNLTTFYTFDFCSINWTIFEQFNYTNFTFIDFSCLNGKIEDLMKILYENKTNFVNYGVINISLFSENKNATITALELFRFRKLYSLLLNISNYNYSKEYLQNWLVNTDYNSILFLSQNLSLNHNLSTIFPDLSVVYIENKENLVLDCNNSYLIYNPFIFEKSEAPAVLINNSKNIIIKNCVINRFNLSLLVVNSENITLENIIYDTPVKIVNSSINILLNEEKFGKLNIVAENSNITFVNDNLVIKDKEFLVNATNSIIRVNVILFENETVNTTFVLNNSELIGEAIIAFGKDVTNFVNATNSTLNITLIAKGYNVSGNYNKTIVIGKHKPIFVFNYGDWMKNETYVNKTLDYLKRYLFSINLTDIIFAIKIENISSANTTILNLFISNLSKIFGTKEYAIYVDLNVDKSRLKEILTKVNNVTEVILETGKNIDSLSRNNISSLFREYLDVSLVNISKKYLVVFNSNNINDSYVKELVRKLFDYVILDYGKINEALIDFTEKLYNITENELLLLKYDISDYNLSDMFSVTKVLADIYAIKNIENISVIFLGLNNESIDRLLGQFCIISNETLSKGESSFFIVNENRLLILNNKPVFGLDVNNISLNANIVVIGENISLFASSLVNISGNGQIVFYPTDSQYVDFGNVKELVVSGEITFNYARLNGSGLKLLVKSGKLIFENSIVNLKNINDSRIVLEIKNTNLTIDDSYRSNITINQNSGYVYLRNIKNSTSSIVITRDTSYQNSGLILENVSNVVIRDSTFTHNKVGIEFRGYVSNVTILNSKFEYNNIGILLNATIVNGTFEVKSTTFENNRFTIKLFEEKIRESENLAKFKPYLIFDSVNFKDDNSSTYAFCLDDLVSVSDGSVRFSSVTKDNFDSNELYKVISSDGKCYLYYLMVFVESTNKLDVWDKILIYKESVPQQTTTTSTTTTSSGGGGVSVIEKTYRIYRVEERRIVKTYVNTIPNETLSISVEFYSNEKEKKTKIKYYIGTLVDFVRKQNFSEYILKIYLPEELCNRVSSVYGGSFDPDKCIIKSSLDTYSITIRFSDFFKPEVLDEITCKLYAIKEIVTKKEEINETKVELPKNVTTENVTKKETVKKEEKKEEKRKGINLMVIFASLLVGFIGFVTYKWYTMKPYERQRILEKIRWNLVLLKYRLKNYFRKY